MAHDVSLTLIEKMQFRLRTGSGHDVVMDAAGAAGGENAGPRPMEMLLAALAGCASMDVISILRKMRQDITVYEVAAHGETQDEHPQRFTVITLTHRVAGRAVVESMVRRAIFLSMSRYCPVYAMLSPSVPIVVRYEISDVAGGLVVSGEVRASGDLESVST
jgi:putative redox protein